MSLGNLNSWQSMLEIAMTVWFYITLTAPGQLEPSQVCNMLDEAPICYVQS